MNSRFPDEEVFAAHGETNGFDPLRNLCHLASQLDTEDRFGDVVGRSQGLVEPEEIQLLVDCLSLILDRESAGLRNRSLVWRLLLETASSTKVFAQNHTLRTHGLLPEQNSPGVYRVTGGPPAQVRMFERPRYNTNELFTRPLLDWVHLLHPNIMPLYATFLEGEDFPSLVTPYFPTSYIRDYLHEHSGTSRLLLVSDIINGLSHVHQLNVIHGHLRPECVLISEDGRALITDLASDPQDFPLSSVRYSAPELLGEDEDVLPTKEADLWSFACLCYEIISGKTPFFHIVRDFRVVGAVSQGSKPVRPGRNDVEGNEIEDTIWQLLLTCWNFEPEERPPSPKVHRILLGMGIQDDRPETKPLLGPEATKISSIEVEHGRFVLEKVLDSEHSTLSRVPGHLRNSLSKLAPNSTKFKATATAAKKLSPENAQYFVDFLDLLIEDLPDWTSPECQATRMLLSSVMMATHVVPQRSKLQGIQYDTQSHVEETSFGRAYQGRGLRVRVNIVTDPTVRVLRSLPDWSRSSHPSIIPFHGVFRAHDSPHLCVVTPSWKNGTLQDYAPTLPPHARISLEVVQITDEGRAVITMFGAAALYIDPDSLLWTRVLRFTAPGGNGNQYASDDIWTFGCICYEVLSRKPPYYYYSAEYSLRIALAVSEIPRRPKATDDDVDEVNDEAWRLIMECCRADRSERPKASEIRKQLSEMQGVDDRPQGDPLQADILALRVPVDVDFLKVEALLGKIQVELLQPPLLKLVQSRIRDVATAASRLQPNDTRVLVDFLDLALKDHLSISSERNRVLALLSKATSSTRIFPQRYELKGVKYGPKPIASGGFGKVYQSSDQQMCIKVMDLIVSEIPVQWIREVILWAHSDHPNVLPFYGVFLEDEGGIPKHICLVSPYMKNRNLYEYAPRFAQRARLPLILDVVNGLQYLHELGIVHGDLKGQNVLISNEGRGMITDFGASHVMTASAAATGSSVFSTLRFSAPEVIIGGQDFCQPSRECDIWSFGCLCYEVLSRKAPYHQYKIDVQVVAALGRKEPPKRPSPIDHDGIDEDEDDWDELELDEDWDVIDDQGWNLIVKCCASEPEDRVKIPTIRELLADMRIWDDRPPIKAVPGADIFKLRLTSEVDLDRAGEVLNELHTLVAPMESVPQPDFVDMYNELE
ncbi:hypothetical protein NP233_g10964 [Leucocoprinus birnbaumii]|uniref:Protein kinase domain-containing protein n=1 Tax=Leucocoprinus birnbaumii TaxID=56174 RepID=A0AAD5YKU8_9AGAR|nr:hypothetical protein NP233_g10964 [Leucocoprinus birnbaumii]